MNTRSDGVTLTRWTLAQLDDEAERIADHYASNTEQTFKLEQVIKRLVRNAYGVAPSPAPGWTDPEKEPRFQPGEET